MVRVRAGGGGGARGEVMVRVRVGGHRNENCKAKRCDTSEWKGQDREQVSVSESGSRIGSKCVRQSQVQRNSEGNTGERFLCMTAPSRTFLSNPVYAGADASVFAVLPHLCIQ